MTAARVALVGLPAFLHDIVANVLAGQPDIAVVGTEDDAHEAIERRGANVVITEDESMDRDTITGLLHRHPDVYLVGISADGRQAYAYEPRGVRVLLGGFSPETLREAVRRGRGVGEAG